MTYVPLSKLENVDFYTSEQIYSYESYLPNGMTGGYQKDCIGCYMEGTTLYCADSTQSDGTTKKGGCYTGNDKTGDLNSTSLENVSDDTYISSCNGNLTTINVIPDEMPYGNGGGYLNSCSGCTYGNSCGTTVIMCEACETSDGTFQTSSITGVSGETVISNCDGKLTRGKC